MSRSATLEAAARPDSAAQPRQLVGMLAEYPNADALLGACRKVRDAGFRKWDAHSPYPVHGIDDAMGIRPTALPWIVLGGGTSGALLGLALQWWTNASNPLDFQWLPTVLQGYQYVISGKPAFSLPANIPVIFELTVLLSAFGAFLGMLALNGLPRLYNAVFHSRRFKAVTDNRFFISVEAADPKFNAEHTRRLLEASGATAVERVEEVGDGRIPAWFHYTGLVLTCLALIPIALIIRARFAKSELPRIHPIQDMDNQERFKQQQPHPLFADGRASRPPVEGTIGRGQLRQDAHFFDGYRLSQDATGAAVIEYFDAFPSQIVVDEKLLDRGQERFGIFCAPCHGYDGLGQGRVRVRSEELEMPLNVFSVADPQVLDRPLGHIFNTISKGIRTMPAYGDQIPEADRWAIVAYVKTLQRAAVAKLDDVPAEKRAELR